MLIDVTRMLRGGPSWPHLPLRVRSCASTCPARRQLGTRDDPHNGDCTFTVDCRTIHLHGHVETIPGLSRDSQKRQGWIEVKAGEWRPSAKFCFCEGFRMPAHDGGAARTGAGVRKPPREETAGSPTSPSTAQGSHGRCWLCAMPGHGRGRYPQPPKPGATRAPRQPGRIQYGRRTEQTR